MDLKLNHLPFFLRLFYSNNMDNINHKASHITFHKNIPAIRSAVFTNIRFWVTLIAAIIFLTLIQRHTHPIGPHLLITTISIVVAAVVGWYVHLYSHVIDFAATFKHIQTQSPVLRAAVTHVPLFGFIIRGICNQLDFHHKIHHDTNINRQPGNLIIEFAQNILTQGLILAIIFSQIGIAFNVRNYPGTHFRFNYAAITMYSLLYATVHIINYNLSPSTCHEQHHQNYMTNFGIDFIDILFNTKFDMTCVENVNHYATNISAICLLLYFMRNRLPPSSPISTFLFG